MLIAIIGLTAMKRCLIVVLRRIDQLLSIITSRKGFEVSHRKAGITILIHKSKADASVRGGTGVGTRVRRLR